MSYDPEGDALKYSWWQQKGLGDMVKINDDDKAIASVYIEPDSTLPIHIICEVHDDGDFNLVSYRRVILTGD